MSYSNRNLNVIESNMRQYSDTDIYRREKALFHFSSEQCLNKEFQKQIDPKYFTPSDMSENIFLGGEEEQEEKEEETKNELIRSHEQKIIELNKILSGEVQTLQERTKELFKANLQITIQSIDFDNLQNYRLNLENQMILLRNQLDYKDFQIAERDKLIKKLVEEQRITEKGELESLSGINMSGIDDALNQNIIKKNEFFDHLINRNEKNHVESTVLSKKPDLFKKKKKDSKTKKHKSIEMNESDLNALFNKKTLIKPGFINKILSKLSQSASDFNNKRNETITHAKSTKRLNSTTLKMKGIFV